MKPRVASSGNYFLRLEVRVLLKRLEVAQSRLRRLAHWLARPRAPPIRNSTSRSSSTGLSRRFEIFSSSRPARIGGLGMILLRALVAPGPKPRLAINRLGADLVQRPGERSNGVDKTDRHRVGCITCVEFCQPLTEKIQKLRRDRSVRDQRLRTEDESDIGDVGRPSASLTTQACRWRTPFSA